MSRMLRIAYVLACLLSFGAIAARAQAPVANFSATPATSCSPALVQFTDLSTNNPTSWSWNLGNGTTSVLQNPSTTYNTPGTYTVSLTVSNASGSNTKIVTSYITILPAPTISFGVTDTSVGCGTKIVQFTNSSSLGVAGAGSYYWDFGDGTNSSAASPTHTYSSTGSYTVSLIVTNSAGCSRLLSKNQYINVVPKTTASFTASNNNSCNAPVTVSFNNTSTGGSSYLWDFGDGTTSTATSPTHTYSSGGSYTVRLISMTPAGCRDTMTKAAFVNIGSLNASFTQSATSTCTRNTVSFTNTTTPGTGGCTWYFGDGTTSTATNPTHAYNTPGTYTVKLVANYNNCTDTALSTVVVSSGPTGSFSGSPIVSCSAPLNTTFTNNTTGATSYLWQFGDGSTSTAANPTHSYTANGVYSVTLISTAANGCADTVRRSGYITIQPISASINSNPLVGCAPATGTFNASVISVVPISSYSWSFGDGGTGTGQSVSHTYNAAGTYTVRLIVTAAGGCTDTATRVVVVSTKPTAGFTASPTTACVNSLIAFTNSSTNATTYSWIFGQGGGVASTATNPVFAYDGPGVYTVTLIASNNGCNDTLTRTNYITINGPKVDFSDSIDCANRKHVYFRDSSVDATGWVWDFGDGSPLDSSRNPQHTYAAYGGYNVTLTGWSSVTGCVVTKTKYVVLWDPAVSFSESDTVLCKGGTLTLLKTNNWTNSQWYFGDGATTSGWFGTHTYNTPGVYTLKAVFTDWQGCRDSLIKINRIRVNCPTAAFTNTPMGGCGALSVTFTDQSTPSPGSTITNRKWVFGDGTVLNTTSTTVTHNYALGGSYTVKLIVTESGGCQDSVVKSNLILVNRPVAQFLSLNTLACLNKPVAFINTSTSQTTPSYTWSFGDGATSTATNPSHSYSASGTYNIRLIATDANGCKDTMTKSAYINVAGITAAFSMSDSVGPCPPFTVNFTNSSSNAVSYNWIFGNGGSSSLANPAATFVTAGTFYVKLIATNANGCKDTATHSVFVGPSPSGTLSYTPVTGCSPLSITLNTTSANTTLLTFDFDNGTTQTTTSSSITYTYTTPGVYIPKVIFRNGTCATFLQGSDTIKNNQTFGGFTASTLSGCVGTAVQFTDTSYAVPAAVINYQWDFGDGSSSASASPSHIYTSAGTYTVRQIVGTSGGCSDTTLMTVVIHPLPVLSVANQTICGGGSAQLSVSGANSYSWTPATGLSCTNCSNPVATPAATTTYTVTGTSTQGCSSSTTALVTVNPKPTVTVSNPVAICEGASTTLTASGATNYQWTPSSGLSCTTCASPTATPASTTTYTVIGATTSGCSDTATVTVTVNPKPVLSTSGNQFICPGGSVSLNASGANSYSWSPATGLSCTTCPNPTASPSATTTYKVVGTSTDGCVDSATLVVNVNQTPTINISGTTTLCAGGSTSLTASGANSYSWTPSTGLSCTNCANPNVAPASTTTYTVTGTSGTGCTGTATVTVTVNPLPTVHAGADTAICAGASATLHASGANSYAWTPSTGLSCTNCANPTAIPTATTSYTVTGTDANGCSAMDSVVVTVNPLPTVSAGANVTICPGGTATLNATGAASYVWTPSAGLSCTTCASPNASPSSTTTYHVTGTSATGCVDTSSVTVFVNPTPSISVAGPDSICAGSSATLTASGASVYSWTPSTGLSCTSCASPTASPAATTTYTVTGTSGTGCTATTTFTLTVNPLPNVEAGSDTAVCAGGSVVLNASGASTYSWSPSTGLSCTNCANPTASPAATTTYILTGTSASGCSNTDTVVVSVKPLPTISAGSNVSICPGTSTVLTASGGVSYVWTPSTGLSCTSCTSPTASPTTNTTYTVTGTGANGCSDTASVTVSINANPTVNVSGRDTLCAGDSTMLIATGAANYSWTPSTGLSCTNCANPVAKPATTTTYTINGSSGAGCNATTSFTVVVNPLPVVSAGADTAICFGNTIALQASGAATYSWSPATGLSCTNCASPNASPTATTSYVVTGTSATGCVNTDTVVVSVNPLPTISAGNNVSICPGSSAVLTASGGVSYSWTPATGLSCTTCASPTASPTANTTYTVTGTNANGCSDTASVTVSINANPAITISGRDTLCLGDSTTLMATGAANYTWTPATGLSCTNCASPVAKPTVTTTYTINGTSGVGCSATTTFTVVVNSLPTVSAGADVAICAGTSATLTASGASSYAWNTAPGLSCTSCANPTTNPSDTTSYIVTGTDANGCVNTDTMVVFVKPLPVVAAGSNVSICPGGSTTLTASGASSYSWSPSTGLSCTNCASPTASPAATTTYTVTGTDASGCSDTASVTVSVNPTPSISVNGTTTLCAGDSTALTASGASTYSWTPATGLSCTSCANPVAKPSSTTTYTVTGTSGVGCTATTTVTVTVNPLPVVSAGADTAVCAGSSVTLTASGASTYVWTPSTGLSCTACASPTASPTATTSYAVTGTSAAGCVNTDTVEVSVKALPVISAGSNASVCPGGSVTLNPSGGVSYVWNTSSSLSCTNCTSPVATPSATTTYTVTGTGANGCSATSSITVTVNPLPVVTVSGATNVCAGGTTTLTASGAASYSWSPATGLSCTTCASPVVTPTDTTIYKVVGTSGSGCTDSTTVTVIYHPLPVISVDSSQSICEKSSVQLAASGALSYSWSPAAGLSCVTCPNPVASPSATTTYIVGGTDAYGCTGTAQTTITVLPLPNVDAGPDRSICRQTSVQLSVMGAVSYEWSPATGLSCTSCDSPIASPLTAMTYVVRGTGANGCVDTDTVAVNIYAQPPVNAGPDQTICSGQSAQLQGSGAVDYAWAPASSLSCATCANPKATPDSTITYMLVGRDAHGCVDSDRVEITVIQRRPVAVSDGGEVCEGGFVELTASGGDSYVWYPAAGLSCDNCANPTASPRESTTYHVSIRQGRCFADTLSADVIIHPIPTIDAGPDLSMLLGNNATIKTSGTNIATYKWSPAEGLSCITCANPVASPARDMVYVVEVASDFGCTAQDEVAIKVMCDGSQIWMPNTFTPNADGQNDHFYPHAKGILTVARFRIYDRWGELIFDRSNMPVNDKNAGWDGTYKNQPLKPDVYVWVLDATCTNGERTQTKGDISLVR